ncbi:MAG: chromosome segregation protein SMC [Alphaproteobacteria bacterium]
MQFTRLRLSGFKSFVDATELWIEPGLTGVVGPNGCGKSNLVEAMRWVMGETSAKQMRGGEMDDVIFGGTEQRPARNMAEVSLVLDNADRSAPSQFNGDDQIDVSRHIERSAGSTYRVNGGEVRARDVQTLFADAASGARSTALVSQGRIGAIVNAKPADRRHILEEAAGITGLHSRRHEAELRLRAAEANMERLDDVLGALDEQLKALKRQARQATRYRNLSDHIRRAEAINFHHQWKEAEAAREAAAARLADIQETVTQLTQEAAGLSTREAEASSALPELRDAEAREAAALQRLLIARDGLDQEERRIQAERAEIRDRIDQIDGDSERERVLKSDAAEAASRLDGEVATLHNAQASEQGEIAAANERLAAITEEVNRLELELTRLTQTIAADETRQSALKRQIAECESRHARIIGRMQEITRERAAAEQVLAAEGDSNELTEVLARTRAALEAARTAFDDGERARAAAAEADTSAAEALREADQRTTRLRAEEDALTALLNTGDAKLWPPMIDAVNVEPGWEMALAAALGEDLQASADEAAPSHWRALAPYPSSPALPAGTRRLSDVVNAPPALTRRLSQIGIVDDDATGNRLAAELAQGQRLIGRDGALWRWDGFTTAGGAQGGAANRLTQRNRLKDLGAERDRAERVLAEIRDQFEQAHAALDQATTNERAAREATRAADSAFQEARDAEAAANRKMAEARSRLQSLSDSAEGLSADEAEIEVQLRAAREELDGLDDIEQQREAATRQRSELSETRTLAADRRSAHDRLVREAGSRRQRLDDIGGELESWRRRIDTADRQMEALADRRAAAEQSLGRLDARPAEIEAQRAALFDQIAIAEKSRNDAADALAEAESALARIASQRKEREAALAEAREERVRCQSMVEQIDQARETIRERADERINCAPAAALEAVNVADDDKLPTREAIEIRLERLRRERENMGAVNLRAEAEAQELDERITTMLSEREDLTSAIARLRQGIANLNREGRTRLLAAFEKVDTHFRELFTRLFGGGRAHLALTEADDPLEAGLEIMASPPGKKLQSMSLLSGGEQALTALSLLFGVFLTNPAPICVLDEVDAPLDDANVERFCQLLNDIAEKTGTRFLIVTHHRLTMARMDRLFGVTMTERGVSQLVSVDLQRAEVLREEA